MQHNMRQITLYHYFAQRNFVNYNKIIFNQNLLNRVWLSVFLLCKFTNNGSPLRFISLEFWKFHKYTISSKKIIGKLLVHFLLHLIVTISRKSLLTIVFFHVMSVLKFHLFVTSNLSLAFNDLYYILHIRCGHVYCIYCL